MSPLSLSTWPRRPPSTSSWCRSWTSTSPQSSATRPQTTGLSCGDSSIHACPGVMPDRPVLPSCHIWRAVLPCDGVTADRPALPSCNVWQAVLPCAYGGPSRHAVLPFMAGRLAMDVGMADHPVLPSCHMAGGGRGVHAMEFKPTAERAMKMSLDIRACSPSPSLQKRSCTSLLRTRATERRWRASGTTATSWA